MKTAFLIAMFLMGAASYGYAKSSPYPYDCPVMPGEKVKEKFHIDYQGKRVYLCCRNCVKAFKRNPEKYADKLAKI